jgi:hypothetical protein
MATNIYIYTRARARARTHTHTHTRLWTERRSRVTSIVVYSEAPASKSWLRVFVLHLRPPWQIVTGLM